MPMIEARNERRWLLLKHDAALRQNISIKNVEALESTTMGGPNKTGTK